ncbi:MAG: NAD(P)H-hydrate epimerase [Pirellulales bacterium]|nr:NAD(P)H-hydrate epimerase [Pirellulales bacterium]
MPIVRACVMLSHMDGIFLTRAQSRAVDALAVEGYGMASIVLMENAGRGIAEVLLDIDPALPEVLAHPVAILCGKGNNGGDGFVMARYLRIFGARPKVLLLAPPGQLRGDALSNFEILRRMDVPLTDLSSTADLTAALDAEASTARWLVDAMLGTGVQTAPREPYHAAIGWANEQAGLRLAVDVPSGLDCDTGEPYACAVRADHTCTLVTAKTGFARPSAAQYLGQLHVVSIGIPPQIPAELLSRHS